MTQQQQRIDQLETAIDRIRKAVRDKGINPDYHHQQANRLSAEWPTLANAITLAIDALEHPPTRTQQ